ncbi:hypothetical protein NKR23_g4787 [Pleurostoma richardsiae]|uniref:Uncharacterized protein n=1 Tax=Pleurostoma richardsiae TaxID=41990 RepID=A0AA38VRG0_9PEZI|nr:hypothetical protein NKR23_g4787 [Pleurostoma richardsiae]
MASRLPPAEKLPLALRKNIRDNWESKKGDLETELSDVLGTKWTVEIDPKSIWPYAKEGYAHESLGNCLKDYVEGAIFQLKYFVSRQGPEGVAELNSLCTEHVLIMDLDESKRFSICGVDIHDGKLRILFAPDRLAVNISDALELSGLNRALNEASTQAGGETALSFEGRTGISRDYEDKVEQVRKQVADLLEKPELKFAPHFEETAKKLAQESKKKGTSLRDDWQAVLGSFTLSYFEGLAGQLQQQKFGEDELLREGFNECVEKAEVAFRVVDKLEHSSYCECVIEDGVLYLQCKPETWGVNTADCAERLLERL